MDDDVVLRAPLFAAIGPTAARALYESMTRIELPRGEAVFHEGDLGDRLYLIGSGAVITSVCLAGLAMLRLRLPQLGAVRR